MNTTKSHLCKPLNVRLLRKIQKHILAEPRRLEMIALTRFGKPDTRVFPNDPNDKQTFPACGTTHCIAGWALDLSGESSIGTPSEINRAYELLGLNGRYINVFFSEDWPRPFGERYRRSKLPKTRARIASQRIDHLITTGE